MSNKIKFVFLLGLARSGTKLFRELLNNHDEVEILPIESNFIPKLERRFKCVRLDNPTNFHFFYQAFLESSYAYNVIKSGGVLLSESDWRNACPDFQLGSVFRTLFELVLLESNPNAKVIGDKTPYYINHVSLLLKLFPDALFVHIVRDPRDRALSEKKTWGKSLYTSAHCWVEGIETMSRSLQKLSDRLVEVRYEDLLVQPEIEISRVVSFLGLSFQSNMDKIKDSPEMYGDAKCKNDVVKINFGKFNVKINKRKIKRIEELTFPWISLYGYPILYASRRRRLSLFWIKLLLVGDKIRLLLFHIKEKGVLQGFRYFKKIALTKKSFKP